MKALKTIAFSLSVLFLFGLSSCKAKKCDCPKFSKTEFQEQNQQFYDQPMTWEDAEFAFLQQKDCE